MEGDTSSGLAWAMGHLQYLLLVAAMLPARLVRVRIGVVASAIAGILASGLFSFQPALLFWNVALLLVNLVLLLQFMRSNAAVRFTSEEEPMLQALLAGLPRARARHFLDQGLWLTGKAGETLIREGEAVTHLFYIAEGDAEVSSGGKAVGRVGAGDLVGEVTVLSGETASATVTLQSAARLWCAPAKSLRLYLDAHHDVRHAVEVSFAAALRHKLQEMNKAVAQAGGIR
ncbi:cyclic nucleotide-binding domain-containing protein [Sphingomonas sp. ID1715]|uniref:Crp/Fnr family transcriptional regulator n=1 Tax=Sphingomonas sp. ID1715 TaxID=1656898 RepID=UPI001487FDF5|nr:cyclic nucleotide-binding domain-containing protein [Sphingomonas sp. ID1715]NNM77647.1 cyclic nucleotide-binding domain-containing protein [Sphingomonas sp. ID1715]